MDIISHPLEASVQLFGQRDLEQRCAWLFSSHSNIDKGNRSSYKSENTFIAVNHG